MAKGRHCRADVGSIDRGLFDNLHPDGRKLIASWKAKGLNQESPFPGFIYLWLATNGWGACVADTDRDADWVKAVAADEALSSSFDAAIASDGVLQKHADAFAALWPIFESRELRRLGVWLDPSMDRADRIREYRRAGASRFAPTCWEDHAGEPPVDWWHSFTALYRVRNNLFHGEKTTYRTNDGVIVERAYRFLAAALAELDVIDRPGTREATG